MAIHGVIPTDIIVMADMIIIDAIIIGATTAGMIIPSIVITNIMVDIIITMGAGIIVVTMIVTATVSASFFRCPHPRLFFGDSACL